MLEQYGIGRKDYRNLLIVVVVVGGIVVFLTEGPAAVRIVAGLVSAAISAVTFLVATIVINNFKPDYW